MHPDGGADRVPAGGEAQAALARLGIVVPEADLPFLERALLRQRELLAVLAASVPADTEPAHVFRVTG